MNINWKSFVITLSLAVAGVQADQLYVFHFQDDAGKKSLTNAGTVKGQADEVPGMTAPIEYSRKTSSGSGSALKFPMDTGGQSGPALSLPESESKLALADVNGDMTIAMWIRWSDKNGVDQNDFQMLVSKMSDSQDDGWAFPSSPTACRI